MGSTRATCCAGAWGARSERDAATTAQTTVNRHDAGSITTSVHVRRAHFYNVRCVRKVQSVRARGDVALVRDQLPGEEYWTEMTLSDPLGQDRIRWLWFQGILNMDDLVIVRRVQPGIECTPVQRGEPTTCSIVESVDSVESWRFEADSGAVADPPFVFADSGDVGTEWSGQAVASGRVSAVVQKDSIQQTLTGVLEVSARDPAHYARFSANDDITFAEDVPPCFLFPYYALPPPLVGGANDNTPMERCGDRILDPAPIGGTVEDGYVHAAVTDSGPNHGLFYVQSGLWEIHRGSFFNPTFDPDDRNRQSLTDNRQHRKCERANPSPPIPGLANLWERPPGQDREVRHVAAW